MVFSERLTLKVRKVLKDIKWCNNVIEQSVMVITITFCLRFILGRYAQGFFEIRTLSIRKVLKGTEWYNLM